MKDIVLAIIGFFSSREIRRSSKVTATFLIILLLLVINNMFGFSFYYNINNKTGSLNKISVLLNDSTITHENKNRIIYLQDRIINKKTIPDYISGFFSSFSASDKNISRNECTIPHNRSVINDIDLCTVGAIRHSTNTQNANAENTNTTFININFWLLISSSWFYILIMILITVLMPFMYNVNVRIIDRYFDVLGIDLVLLIPTFLHYKLFGLIPVIYSWTVNYIIYAVIQVPIIYLFYMLANNSKIVKEYKKKHGITS